MYFYTKSNGTMILVGSDYGLCSSLLFKRAPLYEAHKRVSMFNGGRVCRTSDGKAIRNKAANKAKPGNSPQLTSLGFRRR